MTNDEVVNNSCETEYEPKRIIGTELNVKTYEDGCISIHIKAGQDTYEVSFSGEGRKILGKELPRLREGKGTVTFYSEEDRDLPPKRRAGIMFGVSDDGIGVGIHEPPVFVTWNCPDTDHLMDDIIQAVTGGEE